jgi:Tfp pilus assembly protein PilF
MSGRFNQWCLLLLLVSSGCTGWSHSGAGELNQQGVAYLAQNNLKQAHALFVEAWKQDPTNPDTLYNLATTYHQHGQMREAERYYRQALQRNSHHAACRHNYYLLLVSEGRTSEAVADAQGWVKTHPQSADALTQLGWLTRLQGDQPAAQKYLEQALSIKPDQTEALLEMGKLYQDFQMYDRAGGLYRRVLQQNPQNAEAQALLAGLKNDPSAVKSLPSVKR